MQGKQNNEGGEGMSGGNKKPALDERERDGTNLSKACPVCR